MYLKQLEVHGFKSFAEKIELNFANGINAVVGPNGSGKSNISDAIRWVLGEQSAKTLRGSKMEDVIFAGSEKKKALGFAEVCITINNSEYILPIEYDEINITRRMYRSGESEYYINKTSCRLKDIYELFMDTGIGRDGYSIIGQGRIDEILSNKSEDRRQVFEEAAGIVKFKARKTEAERKLENTKQNITRVMDIIEEISTQLDPMKEQAEVAKRYRDILQELKGIEINLILGNIDKFKARLKTIIEEAAGIQSYIEEKTNLKQRLEEKQKQLKLALNSVEKLLEELQQEAHQIESSMQQQEGEYKVVQEKINNIENAFTRLHQRKRELEQEHQKSSEAITENNTRTELLQVQQQQLQDSINEKSIQFEEYYASISIKEADLDNMQQLYISLINTQSEIKSKINSSYSFLENIDKRNTQILQDIDKLSSQLDEKKAAHLASEEGLTAVKQDSVECKIKLEQQKQNKQSLEKKIVQLEHEIYNVKSSKDSTSSRLKVLEDMEKDFEGYSKSVKALLANAGQITKGMLGAVGEMIKVPSQYVAAIDVALGAQLQSVVTEKEEDAKLLIEYLKKHKLGRATFLPISSIKPRSFSDREKNSFKLEGFVGIASKLVSYDNKIENIIHNLLGRIAIVKDMDAAIKLARMTNYEFRIVTLTGEVLNAGGSITGGSLNAVSSSVLSRKNEIEQLKIKYLDYKQSFEGLLESLGAVKQQLSATDIEISNKTDEYHKLQIELTNFQNKFESIKSEMQILNDRILISKKEAGDLSKESDESKKLIAVNQEKDDQLEQSKRDMEARIAELQYDMKQLNEVKDAHNSEVTDFKVKLSAVEQHRKNLLQQNNDLVEKIKQLESDMQSALDEINQSETNSTSYEEQLKNTQLHIKALKQQLEQKQQEVLLQTEQKHRLQENIEASEEGIRTSQQEAVDAQNNLHKIEMQKAKVEFELDNIELKLLETYELNYHNAQGYRDESVNLTWAARRCEELKSEIRAMGTVNVNAVEEYEKLSQRYVFLNNQVEDLTKARESLTQVIVEIAEHMKEQFIVQFHKINENFNEVFVQLFGGGQAQLVISDVENILESGIEIIAKPPGKKLQNLMLLSGGERALTAIALLFAILKMKPAPFCVLDEIDAALDDANVDRYAAFLKEFAQTTQFIIVTHRKGTMEAADCLYGVSMEDSGISKLLSVKLEGSIEPKVS
ncbi:MAG: chromosome segregation protein SMC [Clostridiales bacterium GWB2_37_7]|nr:MAG: chromosome segregation protein SMC [Clostridiales bacterium GWB2_37_7]